MTDSVVTSGGLPAVESSGTDYLSKFLDLAGRVYENKTAADIRDAQYKQDLLLKRVELDSNVNARLFDLKLNSIAKGNRSYVALALVVGAAAGIYWLVK